MLKSAHRIACLVCKFSVYPRYVAIIFIALITGCSTFPDHQPSLNQNTSSNFMLDISEIVGTSWDASEIWLPADLADMKGESSALLANANQLLRHKDNYLAFIDYRLFEYADSDSSSERFRIQKQTIFYDLNSAYKWETLDIQQYTPGADGIHAACKDIKGENVEQDTRCALILRYDRFIVYMNIWRIRDNQEYLSMETIFAILRRVNAKSEEALLAKLN